MISKFREVYSAGICRKRLNLESDHNMNISNEVSGARNEIRTDGYAMSIGEWVSMYQNGELDIHPEFQRFFRWSSQQKSNLIESILLGIPLPPIFVSQRGDGVWDVIDGLQRLSTIFQVFGVLTNEEDNLITPLILEKTTYLPSLAGIQWESEDKNLEMPSDLKLILKRSKLHVSIVLKESDEKTKYDLFQRLNTGGTQLSPQEVRNCILVMVNKTFYSWLRELASFEPFQETISLSDKALSEAYDIELVLRFLLLVKATEEELVAVGDVGQFLGDRMVEIANDDSFDRSYWEKLFKSTFEILSGSLGDRAFKRFNQVKDRHEGGFLVSQFEAVTSGIAVNQENSELVVDLESAVAAIWSIADYTDWVSSGITASRRLRRIIPFARNHFKT